MEKRKLEVLAPAGSFESLKAAVSAGADAVYMGGSKFGARAYAQNPEGKILLDAIDYAHLYGVKLYLTVNTLLKDQELEQELYEYLKPCYEHGLDAVLVPDLGVLCAIRKWFPSLPVHASTQMTICGPGSVELLKEMGVERAVLSRELSLKEIADIYQKTGMELETFVHGALCYCYSGQCLFSSILGGRSGNRGRCAQPCRLAYQAVDEQKKALTGEQTLLSPKDICALDLIPQIAEAGVYSLKIEGRMKRPEYTAGVVRIYRKYVDQYLQNGAKGYQVAETDRKELLLLFNRDGFSRGYYEQHNGRNMMALENAKASDQEKRAYEALIEKLHTEYVKTERKVPVRGQFRAVPGEPMQLTLSCKVDGQICQVEVTGEVPQQAQNRPMEEAQFLKQMKKLGGTPFTWEQLDLHLEGTLFVPVGALNNLRRAGLEALQKALRDDVKETYNMVSVDGDTSTNDSVVLLANGMAGNEEITAEGEDYDNFCKALHEITTFLAKKMAGDGEGATALFETKVIHAASKEDARTLAKSVICSSLTKAAIFGHDANWGRILCALGYSGAKFDPENVDLYFESKSGKIHIFGNGVACDYSEEEATKILSDPEVTALVDMHMGDAEATAWGCDLSYDYVKINADYRS